MKAVILAGGKGTRLAPYTTVFPKPLMPVGDKPILEIIINRLKAHGITDITLAVGYLADLLKAYFNDGQALGVNIHYSMENNPLGTAGPIAQIDDLTDTFLVMNGDILSDISIRDLIKFHKGHQAIATVAVHQRSMKVDYGVIKLGKNHEIADYIEKPVLDYDVSMGIYIFEPMILNSLKKGEKLDFPDLILKLIKAGEKVVSYGFSGTWLDIGRHDDYEKAQVEYESLKLKEARC